MILQTPKLPDVPRERRYVRVVDTFDARYRLSRVCSRGHQRRTCVPFGEGRRLARICEAPSLFEGVVGALIVCDGGEQFVHVVAKARPRLTSLTKHVEYPFELPHAELEGSSGEEHRALEAAAEHLCHRLRLDGPWVLQLMCLVHD